MNIFATLLEKKRLEYAKQVALSSEDIDLSLYINQDALHPSVIATPFPHIVVDNFFRQEVYAKIEEIFLEKLAQGLAKDSITYSQFHLFDIDYDGYKFSPRGWTDSDNPLYPFYSAAWNNFFSQLFGQVTTTTTSLALHHHPPGDATGFVHHDFADKYFDERTRLLGGVIPHDIIPSSATPKEAILIERRIIAIIYYVANPQWSEGDGGETGLYDENKERLLKKVPPVNNRLLAFHISEKSMHAFQSNKLPRNCIVQWFHIPEKLFNTQKDR